MSLTLRRSVLVCLGVTSVALSAAAQSISGFILNDRNEPIPFANVFVREVGVGAAADANGKYFLTIDPGVYNLVISSLGFEPQTHQVVVRDKPVNRTFYLVPSSLELEEVVVRVRRRDPAYEIIQEAVRHRERYLSRIRSYRTKVYVRAAEEMDFTARKKARDAAREEELEEDEDGHADPFEKARQEEADRLRRINLTEMNLILNYEYPDRYKEERVGFKSYGSRAGLFIPLFSDADFNFYRNLVDLRGISEVPAISPISRTSILSYRFQLDEILKENGNTVYKIKFTPRKSGDATGRGFIFINDSTWNINRLEFTLSKGGLKFYDEFVIRQVYEEVGDSLWIPSSQEFEYRTKSGSKIFRGSTTLAYSEFDKDYIFPPGFFGNEVAVTTREAYERDSSYWNATRPRALTPDQRKMIDYRDSVERAHTDKSYLDSLEAHYNRITLGEVLYSGVGFRNDSTKRWINISSLANTIGFEIVGGWRIGPRVSYWKQFPNGTRLGTSVHADVGIKNTDLQGAYSLWLLYDPMHLAEAVVRFGRSFYTINAFDAYLNQLRISNYIVHDQLYLLQRRELFNGFMVHSSFHLANRQPVTGYDATTMIDKYYKQGEPLQFDAYKSLITWVSLSFTPFQRYMREPDRKVVLGSRYPRFSISHTKAWRGAFGSDTDFDYVEAAIGQRMTLGTLGNSWYNVSAGKFLNTRVLPFIDLKRFRQSDPYLWSDPMHSFQLLDTALSTTQFFLEAHYLHHFNGAMINNIPLVKKLRLRTVAGAGFMWVRENNYRHEELFGGIERIFKIGARRRLKIGFYGVLAQSNYTPIRADWKVSFDIIDTWKREWSY